MVEESKVVGQPDPSKKDSGAGGPSDDGSKQIQKQTPPNTFVAIETEEAGGGDLGGFHSTNVEPFNRP